MGERGGVIDYVQGETGPSGPPPSLPVKLVRVFGSFVLISVFMPLSTEQQKQSLTEHLTLRRLMSYIYMEHPFLMFLDHTQRRSTVGRTPLDE